MTNDWHPRYCVLCFKPATYEADAWTDIPDEGTDGPTKIGFCDDHVDADDDQLEAKGYFSTGIPLSISVRRTETGTFVGNMPKTTHRPVLKQPAGC